LPSSLPVLGHDCKRIAQLAREIEHITGAIADGLLSPALAQKLRETEAELACLKAAPPVKRGPSVLVPNVRGRFAGLVSDLDQILLREPERGRVVLHGILGEKIRVRPDESGEFLWAEYSLGMSALLPNAEIMVAGARFGTYFRPRIHRIRLD
jgi:hypothetical protein